jgi:hypothetical protein
MVTSTLNLLTGRLGGRSGTFWLTFPLSIALAEVVL